MEKHKEHIGIDIFSGAGGMSIGAIMAGIKVKVAVENNVYAAESFTFNHPNTKVVIQDIAQVSPEVLIPKPPFILFGGPPCQGFSSSNTKTRDVSNPNNSLFEEYLRFVKVLHPEWLVFENVEGFQNFQKGLAVQELERRLRELGYRTNRQILWASDYGVPQKRNRFFLVGNRHGVDFEFPKPFDRKVTVAEAIYDLPTLANGDNYYELPYRTNLLNDYTKIMREGCEKSLQNYVSRNKDYVIERYKFIKPG